MIINIVRIDWIFVICDHEKVVFFGWIQWIQQDSVTTPEQQQVYQL